MSEKTNRASPKWAALSQGLFGNADGRHCHWCRHISCEDGISCGEGNVRCTNTKSQFCDGKRIPGWEGDYCALNCAEFELNDWYASDANYDATFRNPEKEVDAPP